MQKQEWHERALELKRQGLSGRQIASVIGKSKTQVNDFLKYGNNVESVKDVQHPRILLIDIETAPQSAYIWKRWKENISQDQVISEGFVLCFAAKWLGDDSVYYSRIPGEGLREEDDREVIEDVWHFVDEADIIIGHNVKNFDLATLNARFVYHGLRPPRNYKIVDTLQIAKKEFRFPSNRLDSLGEYLGLGRKVQHGGFRLWRDCLAGVEEAWQTMETYNIQDVELLEDVYMKLRAWDKTHPNVALYSADATMMCPCCGSDAITYTGNHVYTNVSKFEEFRCQSCGKLSRGRKNKLIPEKRELLLTNAR